MPNTMVAACSPHSRIEKQYASLACRFMQPVASRGIHSTPPSGLPSLLGDTTYS